MKAEQEEAKRQKEETASSTPKHTCQLTLSQSSQLYRGILKLIHNTSSFHAKLSLGDSVRKKIDR